MPPPQALIYKTSAREIFKEEHEGAQKGVGNKSKARAGGNVKEKNRKIAFSLLPVFPRTLHSASQVL